jgi:2-polyprenyl-3-methyl-5-hydroxy-6-metoxy-1,4-benzoquinol methylase
MADAYTHTERETPRTLAVDRTVRIIQQLTDAALGRTASRPALAPRVDHHQIETELAVVKHHARIDEMPTPPGSLPALKRAVLRVAAFNWNRQRAVNVSAANALTLIATEIDELRTIVSHAERRAAATSAARDLSIDELRRSTASSDELRHVTAAVADLRRAIDATSTTELKAQIQAQSANVARLEARLLATDTRLLTEQRHTAALRAELMQLRNGHTGAGQFEPAPIANDVSELYSRFEAAFRPSDEELVRRFEDYLGTLSDLRDGTHPLIDVGAGRGEFVELLAAEGIPARGVDLNVDAVEEAQRNGRSVEIADAITYLSGLESESVGAVTAFHLVEHLQPEVVLALLDESLRVLKPGGALIIETPNPTNLNVGAAAFYHDPTHVRPVTPTYLEFLVRDRGFTDVETRFLHPSPEFALDAGSTEPDAATRMLLEGARWALQGPMDYAVIARRTKLG